MDTQLLRGVGMLEGLSLLLLLFVAMPLKYVWGYADLVPYVGMAHGVLFVVFLGILLATSHKMQWSIGMFCWVWWRHCCHLVRFCLMLK